MTRESARFIAQKLLNFTTSDVYEMWEDMGLVIKNNFGSWSLTDLGRSIGGRISKSSHSPVPTFDSDKVINMMIDFYNEHHK